MFVYIIVFRYVCALMSQPLFIDVYSLFFFLQVSEKQTFVCMLFLCLCLFMCCDVLMLLYMSIILKSHAWFLCWLFFIFSQPHVQMAWIGSLSLAATKSCSGPHWSSGKVTTTCLAVWNTFWWCFFFFFFFFFFLCSLKLPTFFFNFKHVVIGFGCWWFWSLVFDG